MAAGLLSLGWLLPNHTKPWMAFHSDAWIAAILALTGLVVLVRGPRAVACNGMTVVAALLLPIPLLQHVSGILAFAGQAWTASAYIGGFMLALLIGQQWQAWRPRWMGDILFAAIGLAAIASVAMQLQQWLSLAPDGALNVWIVGSDGARPSANMEQPNQLATLLLWGLLACAWGVWRKQLGRAVALITAGFLLIGLALTQSRTGALGLFTLGVAAWWWRRRWQSKAVPLCVTSLAAFYVLVLLILNPLRRFLMLEVPASMVQRLGHELRPELWRMLWDAACQQPWSGYGWSRVAAAQIAVAENHPALHVPFFHSHNLFLDFVLWMGIPLGLLLTGLVLCWVIIAACRVRRTPEILFFLAVVVVGIHAMLELPLHYAYFLLPTGLMMGALTGKLQIFPLKMACRMSGRWILLGTWCLGVTLLGLIVRDYFRVEAAYASLQLEKAQLVGSRPASTPTVLLLTDLREMQRLMKFEPNGESSPSELQWAKDVTAIWPSAGNFMKLAKMLGLNHQPNEAQRWLVIMCRIVPREQCASAPAKWEQVQRLHPTLTSIQWPVAAEPRRINSSESR
ncbi:MAG: O-antigen ligase C-terminal domain-containing protein [Proteobacteria bacterium]|nr:O-antigen ligase C-terminal domain-containing protein [Pseudomonadota bacterium]